MMNNVMIIPKIIIFVTIITHDVVSLFVALDYGSDSFPATTNVTFICKVSNMGFLVNDKSKSCCHFYIEELLSGQNFGSDVTSIFFNETLKLDILLNIKFIQDHNSLLSFTNVTNWDNITNESLIILDKTEYIDQVNHIGLMNYSIDHLKTNFQDRGHQEHRFILNDDMIRQCYKKVCKKLNDNNYLCDRLMKFQKIHLAI